MPSTVERSKAREHSCLDRKQTEEDSKELEFAAGYQLPEEDLPNYAKEPSFHHDT